MVHRAVMLGMARSVLYDRAGGFLLVLVLPVFLSVMIRLVLFLPICLLLRLRLSMLFVLRFKCKRC